MRSQQGQVQPKRLVAVGTVSITTIYRVETIPAAPAKVLANQACRVVDGMAVSAACAFVRLGGQATAWARVGDDVQGVHMREALLAEGIDISCLRTVSGTASSHVSVLVDAKGQRLVVPFHDLDVDDSAGWLPLATLKQADMVHCDARWVNGAEAALKAASALGLPRMIDGDVAPKKCSIALFHWRRMRCFLTQACSVTRARAVSKERYCILRLAMRVMWAQVVGLMVTSGWKTEDSPC
jgi:sugar/nucleoside kinase (ribokinase family)